MLKWLSAALALVFLLLWPAHVHAATSSSVSAGQLVGSFTLGSTVGFGLGHWYAKDRWTSASYVWLGIDAVVLTATLLSFLGKNPIGPVPMTLFFAGERGIQGASAMHAYRTLTVQARTSYRPHPLQVEETVQMPLFSFAIR